MRLTHSINDLDVPRSWLLINTIILLEEACMHPGVSIARGDGDGVVGRCSILDDIDRRSFNLLGHPRPAVTVPTLTRTRAGLPVDH